jgi:PhnB protein
MTRLDPYLSFDGNCAEAMRFYERVLGGKLEALLTNAQTPAAEFVPPGNEDRIMHALLEFDGRVIMAGDGLVNEPFKPMQGFHLTLSYESLDRAKEVFAALAGEGRVTMPFDRTFWAEGSGMLVDGFGTPWIVNGGAMPQSM